MFSMVRRSRWRSMLDCFRQESARPVYVLNLIDYRNFAAYRWYGLFVYPAVRLTGGGPVWIGEHVQRLQGDPVSSHLLVVRYPSHQRFLAMILNPYYMLINELREAGVERFEGAFSRAVGSAPPEALQAKYLLGVHGNEENRRELDRLSASLRGAGFEQVLELRQYAALPVMDPPLPSDPAPHTFKVNMFFTVQSLDQVADLERLVAAKASSCNVQIYQAARRRTYLPGTELPAFARG